MSKILLLVMGLLANSAYASQVSINNYSFEHTVLADGANNVGIYGWINTTGGAFNPIIGPGGSFSNPVPDGSNTAWLNSGSAIQTLAINLTANTSYTLMAEVGDRKDSIFPGYRVGLFAGTTLLASDSLLQPNDGFLTSVVTYTALPDDPSLGKALTIELRANGIQVNFDNIRLDASPVPIPASFALFSTGLGLMGFAVRRRKNTLR